MLEGLPLNPIEKGLHKRVQNAGDDKESGLFNTVSAEEVKLSSRELVGNEVLKVGSNSKKFITLKDDGAAVFKPQSGEVYLSEIIEAGSYFKRERAAYLVDKFFDFELVPTTVIRNIDQEVGSVQQFIPGASPALAWNPSKKPTNEDPDAEIKIEQMIVLALFDYLIFNNDRHYANALVKDKKLYAIDHGLAFGDSYYRNDVLLDNDVDTRTGWLCGENIPEHIRAKIKDISQDEERVEALTDSLRELLSEKEVEAFLKRLEKVVRIVEAGSFPSAGEIALEFTFDGTTKVKH